MVTNVRDQEGQVHVNLEGAMLSFLSPLFGLIEDRITSDLDEALNNTVELRGFITQFSKKFTTQ